MGGVIRIKSASFVRLTTDVHVAADVGGHAGIGGGDIDIRTDTDRRGLVDALVHSSSRVRRGGGAILVFGILAGVIYSSGLT